MDQNAGRRMPRRMFLGIAAAGAAHVGGRAFAGTRNAESQGEEGSKMTKCKHWMHGFGGDDPKATAEALKDAGFDIVVAGGPAVEAVKAAGMDPWLCGGAFGLGSHKDDDSCKAVDITGKPQIWFGSGCPNNSALREGNLESYRKMAATEGIKGILVDGCRFASPASGLGPFLTCFCDACRDKAGRLGFDFEEMKRDVEALHAMLIAKGEGSGCGAAWIETPAGVVEWLTRYPGVLEWLRFRRTCVTEHFRAISEIIHGAGLRMGVYIFTPSLAPLVGQSYVDLREFMDVFAPMIYRNYPKRPGEACVNWELTIIPEELELSGAAETKAMGLILAWAGLSQVVKDRTIEAIRTELPPEAVGQQTALARAKLGEDKELAPIIYIDDPLIERTARLVRESGANGVNFFVFKKNWREFVLPGIEK